LTSSLLTTTRFCFWSSLSRHGCNMMHVQIFSLTSPCGTMVRQVSTDNAICTTHYHASKLLIICSTTGCEYTAGTTWQVTYATWCVLCMGLSQFRHSATPFLHRCTDMFYSLCIFSSPHNNYRVPVPKCVMNAYMKHVGKTCTFLSSQVEKEE
jgi:hypothetical protein